MIRRTDENKDTKMQSMWFIPEFTFYIKVPVIFKNIVQVIEPNQNMSFFKVNFENISGIP